MEKLKQILAQEDTVLFIGSGISIWSGLPSWSSMIEELARFVESTGADASLIRTESQRGDLLQAASYGFDKLTKQQIGEFIRASCRYGIAKPQDIHQKIVSLGPRCFVTTNYDNLIEESLRMWMPDRFFRPPTTNRHLTETAEVVHARAIDFIFKPHGDAADSDSIILTREQYRQLLPQGERQAALESLKMLLASRPVVYLGFSLRDPDFIYVRDLLANTYKGGVRDHFAIMADVSEAESDYWRRHYGIHLISYTTIERSDKTKDHTALLTLLDTLLEKDQTSTNLTNFDEKSPDVVLALARYAAGLARTPKMNPEFQIRVHINYEKLREHGAHFKPDKFDHYPVEKFLVNGPDRALLVGLPGAGKTYSLRQAAARLSEQLHASCLSESFDEKSVIIPIYTDLKLYRGNLLELVSQKLPKSLPFEEIIQHFKVKIFLDSFNEISREYLEKGTYESDFLNFIAAIGNASLIIGSRTNDGLSKLGLREYYLDQIDESTVSNELQQLGVDIGGRFSNEVIQLLQRPFFFQYVANGDVRLSNEAHPKDFYQLFFDNLRNAFIERFGKKFDIEKALSFAAYNALNRGEEAFPLSEFLQIMKTNLEAADLLDINARDVANWLVASSILIPYTGGRVAFVHQSVTEYLAATELAHQYQNSPQILKEKLSLTRWDQALFLTLSLLPPAQAEAFLQDVTKVDFTLAVNSAKYIESGRDEIVSRLLDDILERITNLEEYDHQISWALESSLPITQIHEHHLRMLMKHGNSIGASAVQRLAALKGLEVKEELLPLLLECCDDFNFCAFGIGRALHPFATAEDARTIAMWANSILDKRTAESSDKDNTQGFIIGAAHFLRGLNLSIIRQEFLPHDEKEELSEIHAEILCDILREQHSTTALNFAAELLLRGVKKAAVTIYFIGKFSKPEELSWAALTPEHIFILESILMDSDDSWGVNALQCICNARPDLAEIVKQKALKKTGIEKAIMHYCVSSTDLDPIFQALDEMIKLSDEARRNQPIQVLSSIEIDWTGKEDLFVKLLKLRDIELASALFGHSSPPDVPNLGKIDIGDINWWLDWMSEVLTDKTKQPGFWFVDQLSELFGEHLDIDAQNLFVHEFNRSDSRYRQLLLRFILPCFNKFTTEAFSDDAISLMLADLNREGSTSYFRGHLLGNTATEKFVFDRLLPLLANAEQPLLRNIQKVLKEAGSRHGRRYIPEFLD